MPFWGKSFTIKKSGLYYSSYPVMTDAIFPRITMLDAIDLEILGLNRNLFRLYMAILKSDGLSAAQLAAVTGITRTNIYTLADQLVAHQLVTVDFVGNKRRYTACDPQIIKQNATERLEAIERLMPELKALYKPGAAVKPKISYYEGEMAVRKVFDELSHVQDDHYCYFGSLAAQLAVEGSDNALKLTERRLRKGIRAKAIRTKAADLAEPFMAGEKYLREVRYFPQKMPESMPDIYIYDHRLAILATYREKYALIIDSQELNDMMRSIWDIIWKISLDQVD